MSSLDERTWLTDELWAQVRPAPARYRVTISVAVLLAAVAALVLSQIGFFHPHVGASYNEASARGNRLTVVLTLYNDTQVPVRVTGIRGAQPGAQIISARFNGVFPPAPEISSPPDGAGLAPFTMHEQQAETVTVVYLLDCATFHSPVRINIGTRNFFGNQTSTATLDSSTSGPLQQICAAA